MVRSNQQHTTRLLAHALGMNYAWGAEFVELTAGDAGDREHTDHDMPNFHGLFIFEGLVYFITPFLLPVEEDDILYTCLHRGSMYFLSY